MSRKIHIVAEKYIRQNNHQTKTMCFFGGKENKSLHPLFENDEKEKNGINLI